VNDTIKIRGAENGRNISNTLNSDRTDGRICDGTQESLSQRNNHKRQHNSEELEMRPDLTKKKPKKYYRVIMRWYSEVDVEASSIEEAEQLGVYHKYSTPHLDEVEVDQIKKSEVDPEVIK